MKVNEFLNGKKLNYYEALIMFGIILNKPELGILEINTIEIQRSDKYVAKENDVKIFSLIDKNGTTHKCYENEISFMNYNQVKDFLNNSIKTFKGVDEIEHKRAERSL